jgi:SAM-dependent methyltransferase
LPVSLWIIKLNALKTYIKKWLFQSGCSRILDTILYRYARLANHKKNKQFRKEHPHRIIPPDYFLYETYRLDYRAFFEDGLITAKEILEWTQPYFQTLPETILDWGCGVSRILQPMSTIVGDQTKLFGCDINPEMILFDQKSYEHINYSVINYVPPTAFSSRFFDLVYGLSVFTHIESSLQESWVREIHRILRSDGVFLFTTHGHRYYAQLTPQEKQILIKNGMYTRNYAQKGHRMMTTYHVKDHFAQMLQPFFKVMEFYEGASNKEKAGGQDLWIVRKLE